MRRWIPFCVLAALGLLAMGSTLSAETPVDLPDCEEVLQTPVPQPEEIGLLLEEDETVEMMSTFTFEGCFTFFPAGPCRDVFRDESGTLWICKACGTTKKPPGGCSVLTGSGFWCS